MDNVVEFLTWNHKEVIDYCPVCNVILAALLVFFIGFLFVSMTYGLAKFVEWINRKFLTIYEFELDNMEVNKQ